MPGGQLSDLEELVLRCRHSRSRDYVAEAVAAYRAGAFRSAIVTTWIAVVYDFLDKLRELELGGDRRAEQVLRDFEKIRRGGAATLREALAFERSVLDMGRDEFELLSHQEHLDLTRLMEDRHRCAHPSMNTEEEVYAPPAELARTHLRNAVCHMLQQPPRQGKAALDRLIAEIESVSFPQEALAAATVLKHGPLARPRDKLVRNVTLVLTKKLLDEPDREGAHDRYLAALGAVRKMHFGPTEAALAERLSDIVQGVQDEHLYLAVQYLAAFPDTWQHLSEAVSTKLETFAANMPQADLEFAFLDACSIPQLKESALERLSEMTTDELGCALTGVAGAVPDEVVDRGLSLYEESRSYAAANTCAQRIIIPLADSLGRGHVDRIMQAWQENSQVSGSLEFATILRAIRRARAVPGKVFRTLMKAHGIDKQYPHMMPKIAKKRVLSRGKVIGKKRQ